MGVSLVFRPLILALPLMSLALVGQTQTVSTSNGTASVSGTVQPAAISSPLEIADEPFALYEGLVRELRKGGYSLFLRHGAILPGSVDQRGRDNWWKDCATTQRLAPEAQPRARAIGEALQKQRIPAQEVLTSEFCRAYETGLHLGLATPMRAPELNDALALEGQPALSRYTARIQELLSRPLPARANRILIGHALPPTLLHPALSFLQEGQTAIFKTDGASYHYITTLSPGQWQWIGLQTVVDTQTAAAQPSPTQSPPMPPLIDPAKEMKGIPLVKALRGGGYNLYMRHAQANIGQDGNLAQTSDWWHNCEIQRNISEAGREQARKAGEAIRNLNIPVDRVITAQFCRTRETGHLLGLGPIEITEDINHQIGQRAGFDVNAARLKRLATIPAKGSNTLLVSHTHASARLEERIMTGLQEAEIIVYKPDGAGGAEPVARISLSEWQNLVRLMEPGKP